MCSPRNDPSKDAIFVWFSWPWQKRKPEFKAADSYKTFELFFLVDILSKSAVEFHLGKLLWCTATNNLRQWGSAGYHEKTHSTCILSNMKLQALRVRKISPSKNDPSQFNSCQFHFYLKSFRTAMIFRYIITTQKAWSVGNSVDQRLGWVGFPTRWRIPVRCQSWTRRCIVWKRRGFHWKRGWNVQPGICVKKQLEPLWTARRWWQGPDRTIVLSGILLFTNRSGSRILRLFPLQKQGLDKEKGRKTGIDEPPYWVGFIFAGICWG